MKTKYRHIHFVNCMPTYWICKNNKDGDDLGFVKYYPRWKRHVFEGRKGCFFDTSCLTDITDFMKQLQG